MKKKVIFNVNKTFFKKESIKKDKYFTTQLSNNS